MKKLLLIFLSLFCLICVGCTDSSSVNEVKVMFDAPSYADISPEELVNKEGEPESKDNFTHKISKGNFDLEVYSYTKDKYYIEYEFYKNKLVRIHHFANNPHDYTEFSGNPRDIIKIFGIEPGEDIEETANTGESYRYCDVTDAVVDFWVTGVDTEVDNSFQTVYITYDMTCF